MRTRREPKVAQSIASNILLSLPCANPDCDKKVVEIHLQGRGRIRVQCEKCKQWSEVEATSTGYELRLLVEAGTLHPLPPPPKAA